MIVGHHSTLPFWRLWLNGKNSFVYLADRRELSAKEKSSDITFFEKSVGDFKGADGRNLTWQVERRVHGHVEHILGTLDLEQLSRFFPDCIDRDDIAIWFRRLLTLELYAPVAYWEAVLADPDYRYDRDLYEASPIVRSYLRHVHGIKARGPVLPSALLKMAATLPWLAFKFMLRPLPKLRDPSLKLGIAHFHGLGKPGAMSDLFWFEQSGLKPEQVQFYDESGVDHGAELKDKGFGYTHSMVTDLTWKERLSLSGHFFALTIKAFFALRPFFSLKGWVGYAGVIEYNRYFQQWLQLFKSYGIRLHIHHGDSNLSLIPHTHALEKACGGVDLTYDFSASGYVLPQLSRPVDQMQYIGWGKWCHRSLEMAGAKAGTKRWKATFLNGYYKHFMRDAPLSSDFADAISAAKDRGRRIIGVFDLSCARARLLPLAAKLRFYEVMADIMEASTNSLFVVKPQRPVDLPPELQQRFAALQDAGICYWAKAGIDVTPLQPVFRHVDFAVGLGGFNSALIEAGSESVPHVFYDEWDCIADNFRETVPDSLFVTDAGQLAAVLNRVDDGSFTVESIPGWPDYLDRLDLFRDAKGHERMGDIVRLWFEAFGLPDLDQRQKLAFVIEKYRQLHGLNAVAECVET
jgi:hypothetical protein